MPDHRVNKPDYADRAVFEALANALMHRDYSVIGSEVHVDMYDDRLDIYSPGGMPDGSLIQNLDIEVVPSIRRNPAIADVFHRLDFAERQGSGLRRICEETENLYGYTEEFAPKFVSTPSAFHVILKNMNFGKSSMPSGIDDGIENGIERGTETNADRILNAISLDPKTTQKQMAEVTGLSVRTVARELKRLQEDGAIERVGSDRAGYWEIVSKD
jgi:predicted HTH transcriptional regulator